MRKYDVIILPSDSIGDDHRRAPAGGGGRGGGEARRCTAAAARVPQRVRQAKASRRCARSSRRAARWSRSAKRARSPIERFGLPLRNVLAGEELEGVLVPGLDAAGERSTTRHPLAYGMPAQGLGDVPRRQPGLRNRSRPITTSAIETIADLRRPRRSAERLAARRREPREEGRDGVGAARRQGRVVLIGFRAAAPRADARDLQARVQHADRQRDRHAGAQHEPADGSAMMSKQSDAPDVNVVNDVTRRAFLHTSLAGAAGLAFGADGLLVATDRDSGDRRDREAARRHRQDAARLDRAPVDCGREPQLPAGRRLHGEACTRCGLQHSGRHSHQRQTGVFATLDNGASTTLALYFMYDVKQFDPRNGARRRSRAGSSIGLASERS